MMENNTTYQKIVKFLVYSLFAAMIVLILYFLGKYVVGLFTPFIISWIIATMLQPIINWFDSHTKIPRKVTTIILVVLLTLALIGLSYLLIDRAISELTNLVDYIGEQIKKMQNDRDLVSKYIKKIASYVPFVDVTKQLENYWDNINSRIFSLLSDNATAITSVIIPFLTNALFLILDWFLVFVIILVSTFYFACDYKKIVQFASMQMSDNVRHYVRLVKNEFLNTTGKYLKAYGLIMFITFLELFVAFYLIGINYSLLLAFIISLIDILPILGVGTVLIPWGVILLISKNYFTGIAILSAYLIITIIREIIEPRIVGKYIGLYPLVTLVAMYVGLKAFGVLGLFAFPVISIILKKLNDEGHIKLWKKPPEGMLSVPQKIKKPIYISKFGKNKSGTDQPENETDKADKKD